MPLYDPDGKVILSPAEILAAVGDQTVAAVRGHTRQLGYALDAGLRRDADFGDQVRWTTHRQPPARTPASKPPRGRGKRRKRK